MRPTFGPLALDLGAWYYWYPNGTCYADGILCPQVLANGNFIKADLSFWEFYFKPTWNVNDFARDRRQPVLHAVVPELGRARAPTFRAR